MDKKFEEWMNAQFGSMFPPPIRVAEAWAEYRLELTIKAMLAKGTEPAVVETFVEAWRGTAPT